MNQSDKHGNNQAKQYISEFPLSSFSFLFFGGGGGEGGGISFINLSPCVIRKALLLKVVLAQAS